MPNTQLPPNDHVQQRLREETIIWLGTVRPDGRPHLVPVWFLWEETGTILIFSQPEKQKIRNIRANANVTLALHTDEDGGDVVIIDGTGEILPDGQVSATLPVYEQKYTPLMQAMNWTAATMAKEYSQAIRIYPTRFNTWS